MNHLPHFDCWHHWLYTVLYGRDGYGIVELIEKTIDHIVGIPSFAMYQVYVPVPYNLYLAISFFQQFGIMYILSTTIYI